MNVFKSLDKIFPSGATRTSGEVVNIQIELFNSGASDGAEPFRYIEWKRKAWYVNASVNAFHMHRALIREFVVLHGDELKATHMVRAKRLIGLAVLNAYIDNCESGRQYFSFRLNFNGDSLPTMYKTISDTDIADITFSDLTLTDLVDYAVFRFVQRSLVAPAKG